MRDVFGLPVVLEARLGGRGLAYRGASWRAHFGLAMCVGIEAG